MIWLNKSVKEKILEKYSKLIVDLNSTILRAGGDWPDEADVTRIVTEALNLIRKTCGENSDYYIELKQINEKHNPFDAPKYQGIIKAAYGDYRDGFANIDSLIRAEIFEDFLSMAGYLFEQGYHIPAASLCGSVLEDSLRKLCDKHNISYPDATKISILNADLAKAGVYNSLVAKEIIAKSDIRNNADHGYHDKFKKADVQSMIEWTRRFIIEYL